MKDSKLFKLNKMQILFGGLQPLMRRIGIKLKGNHLFLISFLMKVVLL